MTLGSLFDGISGFPLAASWAGIETKWISEIDPYCLKVSKKNFPNAKQYGNIQELYNPEPVDIISGGFPCQPFSIAGQQQGKEDDRYLWPEMLRVVSYVRPRWVIGENVSGIINMALDEVLSSLENEGYKTETFIIPACGINAWHKRERVWICAHSEGKRSQQSIKKHIISQKKKEQGPSFICSSRRQQQWEFEPSMERVAYGIPRRVDRIKALGNAIVPQVAYEIFKAIVEIENKIVK